MTGGRPARVRAALARARRVEESLMTDAVAITRASGDPTVDPLTGQDVQASVTVYAGRGRLSYRGTAQGAVEGVGEADYGRTPSALRIPADAPTLRRGDAVAVTASALTPAMVGARAVVAQPSPVTHQTAQRVALALIEDPA